MTDNVYIGDPVSEEQFGSQPGLWRLQQFAEESENFPMDEAPVDPWDYDPPEVAWVPIMQEVHKQKPTGETYIEEKVIGYRVEPPFGLTWPPLQTLRHYAALIEHRTGQKVRVIPNTVKEWLPFPDDDEPKDVEHYEVRTDHVTGGPAPYDVTYSWLSGYENGIYALLWAASKNTK
jgi:hypothetical protein